jgi:hypothetical protein
MMAPPLLREAKRFLLPKVYKDLIRLSRKYPTNYQILSSLSTPIDFDHFQSDINYPIRGIPKHWGCGLAQ